MHQAGARPGLTTSVGGRMLFIHFRYSMVQQVMKCVVASLSAACVVLPGTREDQSDRFFHRRETENVNTIISRSTWTPTISCVSRKFMEKTNSSRPFRFLRPGFSSLELSFKINQNTGGSASCIHKDVLPDETTVTHIVTCPGRDHIVSIQSERTKIGDRQRSLRA